jgi:hypothetical protein
VNPPISPLKENIKNKIEDARLLLEKINPVFEDNNKVSSGSINNKSVKTFDFSEAGNITKAEDGSFAMISVNEGKMVLLDNDADGSVDRVVMNHEEEEVKRGSAYNQMFALSGMEELTSDAKTFANMKPEEVRIMNIDHKNSKTQFVNMADGGSGTIDGKDAKEMIEYMQARYTKELKAIAEGLEK